MTSQSNFINAADPDSPLDIVPYAGRIGAIVQNIKLEAGLDDKTFAALRKALARHKVLFFRDQGHLTDSAQERFAEQFGKPVAHPTVPVKNGSSYLLELDSQHGGRANTWHTDVTFVDAYPSATILRAVTVPQAGGDTVWANTAAAYNDLSEELRAFADTLWAHHTNDYDYAERAQSRGGDVEQVKEYQKVFTSTVYETLHPVVHVHPETGERNLLLGGFVQRFAGLSKDHSAKLFDILQGHVIELENTARWKWAAGDVVIWDNRATEHYAINDYGDQHRVVRRVTIAGDVPVAIDGRRSLVLKPEPAYHAQAAE